MRRCSVARLFYGHRPNFRGKRVEVVIGQTIKYELRHGPRNLFGCLEIPRVPAGQRRLRHLHLVDRWRPLRPDRMDLK